MLAAALTVLSPAAFAQVRPACPETLPPLPPAVAQAKAELIEICESNLDRWGDPALQTRIDRRVRVLSEWFANNRPANELATTQGSWKAIWYEDTSFVTGVPGLVEIDRENTYQVVRDGYYYNVSKVDINLLGRQISLAGFLKGEFTITNPAGPGTCGQQKLNVIDLEFTDNRILPTWLPPLAPLTVVVELVDAGRIPTIPVPGPDGVTGELWNLYVDQDLRVAFGNEDDETAREGSLFVLVRQETPTADSPTLPDLPFLAR